MKLNDEMRAKLRQTFGQMKHEIGCLQQALQGAPEDPNCYEAKYTVDEYLLAFRLGNVSDLSMHLLELLKLAKA